MYLHFHTGENVSAIPYRGILYLKIICNCKVGWWERGGGAALLELDLVLHVICVFIYRTIKRHFIKHQNTES